MKAQVELRGITKRFNGVVANNGVDFLALAGETHALVGENGAGKTTLMNILYGLVEPDSGEILIRNRPVAIRNPQDSIRLGIGMVHQHFMLVPSMTVLENIVLGHVPLNRLVWRPKEAEQIVSRLQRDFGLVVPLHAKVQELSVGLMQRVEILKVLYRGAEVLILDEPTAALTPQETRELFVTVRALAAKGHTVIFITHKLREVMTVSDRVTAMRAGRVVGTVKTAETTPDVLARMMVGRELQGLQKVESHPGETVMEVTDLHVPDDRGLPAVRGVSLSLRRGEILGVAGVEGNGQRELVEALIGVRPATRGTIRLVGREVTRWSVRERRQAGLGHIPEDRIQEGLALPCSVAENLIMGSHNHPPLASRSLVNWSKVREHSARLIREFGIKVPSASEPAWVLSGGNLQKLVVARELDQNPHVLLASQPTRGVDIGSAEHIHRALLTLRDAGRAILLVSADLDEIMALSDRIAVMYEGEIVGELSGPTSTEEEVGALMFGTRRQGGAIS